MTRTAHQLVAGCMLLIAQTSVAAGESREGLYFTLEGGVNFLQDNDLTVTIPNQPEISGELFYDTGWAAGAAAGYEWANGIALQAELVYRQNGIDGEEVMGMRLGIDGTESSMAFMGNAKFNLDTGTLLTPFVGAGVGLAVLKVDAQPDGGGDFKDTDTQFAYQAMAGVSYAVSEHLHLALEYIYFATTSPTFAADSVSVDMNYHSQNLFMSLSYDLQ
jgi:opacity protein-like surface antigen